MTAAVLAGRYLEARARDRSGLALTALAALGAKTVAVLRDGAEQRVPAGELAAGDLFVVRPGEKIATDGDRRRGQLGGGRVAGHRRVDAGRGRPGRPGDRRPR